MQAAAFTHTRDTSELDELQEVVKGSDLEHTQLAPGRFQGRTTRISLGASVLDFGRYNRAIRARGSIGAGFKTFFFMPHQGGTSNGLPVNKDSFVAFGSGATADAYGAPSPEWMTLTIQHDEWLKLCRDMDHWTTSLDEPRAFSVTPEPPSMTGLLQTLQAIADRADARPNLFSQASVRELIHQELASRISHCLSTTDETYRDHVTMPLHRRYRIVKRAEAYILAHLDRKISVADLVESVEVSERSLQYAFQDVWGVSPFEYLTKQRLNKARRDLYRAVPGQTTVAYVATASGFWHLGRFSGAYRALFGELPSETLRRHGVR